jgi:hypothetical protein
MNRNVLSSKRVALMIAAIVASPVFAQPAIAPTLIALGQIETGQWQLRSRDSSLDRSVCVSDPRTLLQVRHGAAVCSRFVIANDARATTIHYTCPGAGHGQTTLRVETPRLIQIESQGIAEKEPFSIRLEGRRVGSCGVKTSGLER